MGFASHVNLVGYNPSVSTTASPVWANGATGYVQLTTGTALEVVSSAAADTGAGTGARTVRVEGVDGSHIPFAETITLNGVTPVPLVNTSVIAINRTTVLTAGSGLANAGTIDVRAVSGGLIKSRIQILAEAINISQDFIYTIPASRYGLLKRIQLYARTCTGDIWCYLRTFNTGAVGFTQAVGQSSLDVAGFNSGEIIMDFGTGLYIPEKTLIQLIVDVSAGTPLVSAIGELELYSS
jgi:hypothetical protein